jgi:hypothetical protein
MGTRSVTSDTGSCDLRHEMAQKLKTSRMQVAIGGDQSTGGVARTGLLSLSTKNRYSYQKGMCKISAVLT